jgi:hypothetical protein
MTQSDEHGQPERSRPDYTGSVPFARRRQHYWDGPLPEPGPPPPAPEPGTGTVYLRETHEGTWEASWQGPFGTDGYIEFTGARDEAIAWAKSRPAEGWLTWDDTAGDYVPY